MAIGERDPHSGHLTTGHEWNGIKELNTPVPRAVWFFLILTVLFSIGWWILMPAWPLGKTYTKGLLERDERQLVNERLERERMKRSDWTSPILARSAQAILADPVLMNAVREDGARLFGDNCAACHGMSARGGMGFPDLTDNDWLWGGSADDIARTIDFGVNSSKSPNSHRSQMLAFGRDGILDNDAVIAVATYVRSLSDATSARGDSPQAVATGRTIFAENCTSCHGADAKGNRELGAPDLTDTTWLYGGDLQTVYTTINEGRQGEMPAWEMRLNPVERKILTVYVLNLGRHR